jgi:glutathione S-transferase
MRQGGGMLRLCGFPISNYYNKVRIALLEKGVAHQADPGCKPSQEAGFLARSPIGKVPFLELDDGRRLSESLVICEYLEDAYPQKPLYPRDAYERAKVRELIVYLELHVELVARRLYPSAFSKAILPEDRKAAVEKDLGKGLRALMGLAKFSPFIGGAELTYADCAAYVHLPLVTLSTKTACGRDFLADQPQVKDYLKRLKARPAFAQVDEERKAYQATMKAAAA